MTREKGTVRYSLEDFLTRLGRGEHTSSQEGRERKEDWREEESGGRGERDRERLKHPGVTNGVIPISGITNAAITQSVITQVDWITKI